MPGGIHGRKKSPRRVRKLQGWVVLAVAVRCVLVPEEGGQSRRRAAGWRDDLRARQEDQAEDEERHVDASSITTKKRLLLVATDGKTVNFYAKLPFTRSSFES